MGSIADITFLKYLDKLWEIMGSIADSTLFKYLDKLWEIMGSIADRVAFYNRSRETTTNSSDYREQVNTKIVVVILENLLINFSHLIY